MKTSWSRQDFGGKDWILKEWEGKGDGGACGREVDGREDDGGDGGWWCEGIVIWKAVRRNGWSLL